MKRGVFLVIVGVVGLSMSTLLTPQIGRADIDTAQTGACIYGPGGCYCRLDSTGNFGWWSWSGYHSDCYTYCKNFKYYTGFCQNYTGDACTQNTSFQCYADFSTKIWKCFDDSMCNGMGTYPCEITDVPCNYNTNACWLTGDPYDQTGPAKAD